MQYIFSEDSGNQTLELEGELYKYIVRVRRYKEGDKLHFRNLKNDTLYKYTIENISKKTLTLTLFSKSFEKKSIDKKLHIFWCIIDPKIIIKTLPFLNQIGVTKITFVYCDRSQKNFKIDLLKLKSILINSSQQSGRTHLMELEVVNELKTILSKNSDLAFLDFGGEKSFKRLKKVLIGCEGGFSEEERELLKKQEKIAFDSQNILKSETAVVAVASKLLI